MTTDELSTVSSPYQIHLDQDACDGIFACLVRDDRFIEAANGLATIHAQNGDEQPDPDGTVTATFDDDRLEDARNAARACPVDAITITERPASSEQVEGTDD